MGEKAWRKEGNGPPLRAISPDGGAAKIALIGPLRRDQASNSILFSYFFVPAIVLLHFSIFSRIEWSLGLVILGM